MKKTMNELNTKVFYVGYDKSIHIVFDIPYEDILEYNIYKRQANVIDKKEYIPRSPGKYNLQQYGSKGTTIFISSIVSAFALSEAILTFDWVQFLSYVFTVLMGVVFGIIQMRSSEVYWTTEYWKYAKYTENKVKEEREVSNGDQNQLQ